MEWLIHSGIAETRAVLVDRGAIIEAAVELDGSLRVGAVLAARLTQILIPGRRGIAAFDGGEALLEPLPPRLTQGQAIRIEIVREAIPEAGRPKRPRARVTDAEPRDGPSLIERLRCSGTPAHAVAAEALDEAGWDELIEEARSGDIPFPGGALRLSLTPAMTLFDVDGTLPLDALAIAGATAAAGAIRRHGIGGSIGIDLPTARAKATRTAATDAIDAILPQPFERTAVNGFGFVQIVRPRERLSLPELVQGDPAGAAARALLRHTEREGPGAIVITAAPAVLAQLRPDWIALLERRIGGRVALQPDPALAISAGHVHRLQS